MTTISLCGLRESPDNCPSVTLCERGDLSCPKVDTKERVVTIGEDENIVTLKPEEWNRLVDLIKDGKLEKV